MNSEKRTSILCPNCRRLISRDETQCPYCGTSKPGSPLKRYLLGALMNDPDRLIKTIIGLNVGMYVITLLLAPGGRRFSANPLTVLSPDSQALLLFGATGTIPIDQLHRWWSLLSANYLHGGILHILFNMLAFRQIAPLIIREYDLSRMLVIYTLGGVAGFAVSYLAGVRFTIGASAAVCSLIGAALYFGKSRGGAYGQAIYRQVGGWAVSLFVFGFLVPGINNWGHAGGMLAGALFGALLGYREKKREAGWHQMSARITAVLTAATLLGATISGLMHLMA